MKNRHYNLLVFDWNGTLEQLSVPALFPEVGSVLKTLYDQGYTLAVASAASSRKLQSEASRHGIDRYFSLLQGSDGLYSKPDPKMLLDITEKLGLSPESTLMIGDTEADMEMAAQAKIDRLAVCYGLGNRERLAVYQPIGFIGSINELLEWLNKGA